MLTAASVARAKATGKDYLLLDTDNLYLRVRSTGAKSWLLRYTDGGRAKSVTLGRYPGMTLAQARARRDALMAAVKNGAPLAGATFADLANDWMRRRRARLREPDRNYDSDENRIRQYVIPVIGDRPVAEITRAELVRLIMSVFETGREESARRVAVSLDGIFFHALNIGAISSSPAQLLLRALPPKTKPIKHFAAVTDPEALARLLRAIETIRNRQSRAAIKIIVYTFVRVGELLRAQWKEIDFGAGLWSVPPEHMKRRRELLVPMPRQVAEIFREVKKMNGAIGLGRSPLVFPAYHTKVEGARHLPETTMLGSLKSLLWRVPGTPHTTIHGFRATASSILNEAGFNPDAIERQLAHVPGTVRAIYNRAEYLDERKRMLQWYADYLDALRDGKAPPEKP